MVSDVGDDVLLVVVGTWKMGPPLSVELLPIFVVVDEEGVSGTMVPPMGDSVVVWAAVALADIIDGCIVVVENVVAVFVLACVFDEAEDEVSHMLSFVGAEIEGQWNGLT